MKDKLLRIAEEVYSAYRELPKDYDGHVKVGLGASGSPTSKIDKFAEDAVLELLDNENIKLSVLSEEAGFVDRGYKDVLVLDPIDGTLNCVRGLPFFSVSMAIGRKSMLDCEHALVRDLANGDIYYARRGGGSEMNGHRIAVSKYTRDESIFSMFMGPDAHPDTNKAKMHASRVRSLGCASLEMCLVARGDAQAHYMNCKNFDRMIRIVDIAASALILREAGGEVVDIETKDRLDMDFDLQDRKNFLAYGDIRLKELILSGSA